MKEIMAPIKSAEELSLLHKLGATEFYCGYMPDYWEKTFNKLNYTEEVIHYQVGINKKDVNVANVSSLAEIKQIVSIANLLNVELYIVVNASFYPEQAYPILKRYLNELSDNGIENLIINDLGMLEFVYDSYKQFKITLSCLTQITNSYSVSFYKKYNIKRIVFPRHMTISEIANIARKNPYIEFEFFVLSGKCIYDDGFCRCHHDFGQLCTDSWTGIFERKLGVKEDFRNIDFIEVEDNFKKWSINPPRIHCFSGNSINMGCSLCSILRVNGIPNIRSLKIAGRGKSLEIKSKMVSLTKKVIEQSEQTDDVEKIKEIVKTSFISNPGICETNNYCYIRGDL